MKKFTLTILATSDIHGYITPVQYSDNKQVNQGLAKLSTVIKQERDRNSTLLIDNGDTIQGSPITYYSYNVDQTNICPLVDIMNYLKYDAHVIGNHEFNYGINYLHSFIDHLNAPVLSCNIKTKDGGYYTTPYTIKEFKDGPKVAIIGVTTHYIPNWEKAETIANLEFEDAFTTLKNTVKQVKENEEVDCIIVSYHGGFERDLSTGEAHEDLTGENQGYQMLKEIEDIDVLITGHQHRSIHEDNIFGKAITQTAPNAFELAKVNIDFYYENETWRVISKKTDLLTSENVEPDQSIMNIIQPLEDSTQEWLDQVMGRLNSGHLLINDAFDARLNKHRLVRFLNQVQMDASGADISLVALANYIKGFNEEITMRDIISTYIYPNTLMVLEVAGQDIKDGIEMSAEYFEKVDDKVTISNKFTYPKPKHYNYDMYDGISYTIDLNQPVGERVQDITHNNQPLNMNEKYQIVMNNYRASGGGNFNMYKNKKVIKDIQQDMVELIANYIQKHKVIDIPNDKNVKIIY